MPTRMGFAAFASWLPHTLANTINSHEGLPGATEHTSGYIATHERTGAQGITIVKILSLDVSLSLSISCTCCAGIPDARIWSPLDTTASSKRLCNFAFVCCFRPIDLLRRTTPASRARGQ